MLRPLWLLIAPPLRFLWARLTPGELGIELTTLLTIAAVGIYVVVLQIDLLQTDALLPGDTTALDIARDIESGFLTALAHVLRVIGSLWFVGLCTVATCAFLLARRRSADAIALAAGLAITEISTQIIKRAVERPRIRRTRYRRRPRVRRIPPGHASLSVTFLAIGVLLSRRLPTRIALVIIGAALAAAIGLSRVYLRVHYLSDVTGGWALGLAAFLALRSRRHHRGLSASELPRLARGLHAGRTRSIVDSLTVTYIILAASGVVGFGTFAVLIFAPAWTSYGRTWERFAAAFLSMFVLAAFAGLGLGIGLIVLYYWDQILDFFGIQAVLPTPPVGRFPPTLTSGEMAEARTKNAANRGAPGSESPLDALAESVESGAGLPETARCAAAALRQPSR